MRAGSLSETLNITSCSVVDGRRRRNGGSDGHVASPVARLLRDVEGRAMVPRERKTARLEQGSDGINRPKPLRKVDCPPVPRCRSRPCTGEHVYAWPAAVRLIRWHSRAGRLLARCLPVEALPSRRRHASCRHCWPCVEGLGVGAQCRLVGRKPCKWPNLTFPRCPKGP